MAAISFNPEIPYLRPLSSPDRKEIQAGKREEKLSRAREEVNRLVAQAGLVLDERLFDQILEETFQSPDHHLVRKIPKLYVYYQRYPHQKINPDYFRFTFKLNQKEFEEWLFRTHKYKDLDLSQIPFRDLNRLRQIEEYDWIALEACRRGQLSLDVLASICFLRISELQYGRENVHLVPKEDVREAILQTFPPKIRNSLYDQLGEEFFQQAERLPLFKAHPPKGVVWEKKGENIARAIWLNADTPFLTACHLMATLAEKGSSAYLLIGSKEDCDKHSTYSLKPRIEAVLIPSLPLIQLTLEKLFGENAVVAIPEMGTSYYADIQEMFPKQRPVRISFSENQRADHLDSPYFDDVIHDLYHLFSVSSVNLKVRSFIHAFISNSLPDEKSLNQAKINLIEMNISPSISEAYTDPPTFATTLINHLKSKLSVAVERRMIGQEAMKGFIDQIKALLQIP